MISYEGDNLPWAAAGQTVTIYMTGVDPIHLNVGSILCPPTSIVPLVTTFTARIIVFDITTPVTAGASVRNPQRYDSPRIDLDRKFPPQRFLGRVVPSLARYPGVRFEALGNGGPFVGASSQEIPEGVNERSFGRGANHPPLGRGVGQGLFCPTRDIRDKQGDGKNFG